MEQMGRKLLKVYLNAYNILKHFSKKKRFVFNSIVLTVVQLMMPESNTIILTDPASKIPLKRNRVTLYPIQGDYSRNKLMLQRIRSYIVRAQSIDSYRPIF